MRKTPIIAVPLVAAALAASGCGGNDNAKHGIPKSDARSIVTRLDQVNANVDAGKCGSADAEVTDLRRRAASLPSRVSRDVRTALGDGIDNLARLVNDQCRQPQPTQTQTTPTETTPTETTPTETTPTETTPPPTETQPVPTTPTTTTPAPTQTTPGPPDTGGTPPGQAKEKGHSGTRWIQPYAGAGD